VQRLAFGRAVAFRLDFLSRCCNHFYHLKLGGAWPTLVSLINHIEELRSECGCRED
jgi:hypothetical protein